MTDEQKQARAALLTEWLQVFHEAIRFGAGNIHAGQIADVLVFGSIQ
jgi:hypothetical protein